LVKAAAAHANAELGVISQKQQWAISTACGQLLEGQHHDQLRVDVLQGGAGTSTNMNINELIANLGLEAMGKQRGEYQFLHPNDHVNASQSTNDAYPTAVKLSTYIEIEQLRGTVNHLRSTFEAKAEEFTDVMGIGRTQLQDAVPMTLGQQFQAYAEMVAGAEDRLSTAQQSMLVINMGGTAIGTGINAPQGYREAVTAKLAELSGVPVVSASNLVEATQNTVGFVHVSGAVKELAVVLIKAANDLRLMASGPQAGLGDIQLPERQAGSSIMPGKVNPVIPEAVNQVAFEAIGNDAAVTYASQAGQLQLNAFEPLIQNKLHESLTHMANACEMLADKCVAGITVDHDKLALRVATSATTATALNPIIGYEKAALVAKQTVRTGGSVVDIVAQLGFMSKDEATKALADLPSLTVPYQLGVHRRSLNNASDSLEQKTA
jgi:aspartate ammonia-lyase